MGITIPVKIIFECDKCGFYNAQIFWYPDDHYKDLAEVEVIKCPICNTILHPSSWEQIEMKLIKRNDTVGLQVGDVISNFLRVDFMNRYIGLNLNKVKESFPLSNFDILLDNNKIIQISFDKDRIRIKKEGI